MSENNHDTEQWSVCADCNAIMLHHAYGLTPEGFDLPDDHDVVVDQALERVEDGGYLIMEHRDHEEFGTSSCDCCWSGMPGPRFEWTLLRMD